MNIQLPTKIGDTNLITIDTKSLIVVGANGSGKSRFGADIEKRYLSTVHRISAQKSLTMPFEVSPKSKIRAESEFLYGYHYDNPSSSLNNKLHNRWGGKPNTFLLNDFEKLLVLLHTEEYEEALKYKEGEIGRPVTKLDRIQKIWEEVLPHRKLKKRAGVIEAYSASSAVDIYNASEMSDGERVIFYLVGEIILAPQNALIIIDEPESHIHKAVIKQLWDKIELERPDCTFVYLTHDIDFASSRESSDKIWMKSYSLVGWDYEILPSDLPIPEQLYLEILGSRQPVLFIEGEVASIDYQLLPLIFSDMLVKPLGACAKVIDTTRTFNSQTGFHHIKSFGLIDRDRRSDEEISHITGENIWIADVAEVENFLLIEDVVKTVALCMEKNPDETFVKVKQNVINFFQQELSTQVTAHTISRIERVFKIATTQKGISEYATLNNAMNNFWTTKDFKKIYDEIQTEFESYIYNSDYESILRTFNNKGLIAKSNVAVLCDINPKNNSYLNRIISLLKKADDRALIIMKAVKNKIQRFSN
jgi:ABC-type dipeptide/oligopeptide/nickel transport system ATPase component